MGFAIKSLLFLLIIAVVGGFIINQIPSLKERVIEAINPAAKEERLLGKLKANLDELGKNLDEAGKQKSPMDKGFLRRGVYLVKISSILVNWYSSAGRFLSPLVVLFTAFKIFKVFTFLRKFLLSSFLPKIISYIC